jgi:hypothetical protein
VDAYYEDYTYGKGFICQGAGILQIIGLLVFEYSAGVAMSVSLIALQGRLSGTAN